MEKITVSAEPLRRILQCALGPQHHILELTYTMAGSAEEQIFSENPFDVLIREYNAAVAEEKRTAENGQG